MLHTQQEKMSITEKKDNNFLDREKRTDMIYSSALILAVLMFQMFEFYVSKCLQALWEAFIIPF